MEALPVVEAVDGVDLPAGVRTVKFSVMHHRKGRGGEGRGGEGRERKDYTLQRQFIEKPDKAPGCQMMQHTTPQDMPHQLRRHRPEQIAQVPPSLAGKV